MACQNDTTVLEKLLHLANKRRSIKHVEQVADLGVNMHYSVTNDEYRPWLLERISGSKAQGQVEAYVCRGCGLTEFYTNGRLEAGERDEAASVLARLLVCGSRGRPWHRHDVVLRLRTLAGQDKMNREIVSVTCEAVDPDGLASSLR